MAQGVWGLGLCVCRICMFALLYTVTGPLSTGILHKRANGAPHTNRISRWACYGTYRPSQTQLAVPQPALALFVCRYVHSPDLMVCRALHCASAYIYYRSQCNQPTIYRWFMHKVRFQTIQTISYVHQYYGRNNSFHD